MSVKVRINNLSASDLALTGAEPLGAEARAKQYTDEKVGAIQIPPMPTLADLGGEPVGAELRARQYTDEKIQANNWVPVMNFQNGWSNYGSGLPNAAFSLDSLKIVRLTGVVKGVATASLPIFTLPAGYRPVSIKGWRAFSPDPLAFILVQVDGQVIAQCTAAGGAYIYLDNIAFPIY